MPCVSRPAANQSHVAKTEAAQAEENLHVGIEANMIRKR